MEIAFHMPRKVLFEESSFLKIGLNAKLLRIRHAFLVYSRSAIDKEKMASLIQQFKKEAIQLTFYEMPKGEPSMEVLQKSMQLYRQKDCDGCIAIGGGSAIDLAKATVALVKQPYHPLSELGDLIRIERDPFIAVPTTAGTGSEATRITVITDKKLNIKYNPGHVDLIPDIAILDPRLTLNVPPHLTAFTAIDALTHAIESFVSTKANEMTDLYALKAINLITGALKTVYTNPQNSKARGELLLGSYYAGLAFSNSSTNLAHSMGRAIGTMWDLPHGQSVAILHPFVIDFSMASCKERYEEVAKACSLQYASQLSAYLKQLNTDMQVWKSVSKLGESAFIGSIEEMSVNALSGNGISTNRKIPSMNDVQRIYMQLHLELKEMQNHSVL